MTPSRYELKAESFVKILPVIRQAEAEGLLYLSVNRGDVGTMVVFTKAGEQMAKEWGIEIPKLTRATVRPYSRAVGKWLNIYREERHG